MAKDKNKDNKGKVEEKGSAAPATATAEKPKEPEGVDLKVVAKKVGLEPRACRALLRSLNIRGADQKRSRWIFKEEDVPGVVAKIQAALKAKDEAKAAKAAEAEAAAKEETEADEGEPEAEAE